MAMDQGYDGASMWREPIATPNRNYKDTVFRDLFGSPERKANALELYNALNGTNYDDPDALELTTLDDVIYLNVKNDVSFLLADEMVLWEHQSTPNPNMPLRGLIYFGRLYSAHIEAQDENMYGPKRISLPTPRYVVFYNGPSPRPDRELIRLSDSFSGERASIEVTCEVVNIGSGCNPDVAEASPTLAGYVYLVERVRDYNRAQGLPLKQAVDLAVDECVSKGYLTSYLERRRSEVRSMFMTEYDEEKQRALDRRSWYEEGVEQGVEQGVAQAAERLRAAGYDEEAVRIALGAKPAE